MAQQAVSPGYRQDIDGLRAIAIISVIGLHAFARYVPGGFVGVDVFFVISGFLISGIILRGLEQGTFSFTGFYARRIRRIFPALIVMVVASLVIGWFILVGDEYKQLGLHSSAGAAFVANFVFLDEAGYFDKAAELKPMLHLWSLGIEEQFYILWPFVLFLAWNRSRSTVAVIVVVMVLSFTLNIWGTSNKPAAAFYLPFPRFWELLAGALLAHASMHADGRLNAFMNFGVSRESRLFDYLPDVKSAAGLMLLLVAVFVLHRESMFPGWWVLLPVVGTGLLISAGEGAWLNRHLLANRLMVLVGLISYPLYLWHWPLLSFARIVESGEAGVFVRVAAVVTALLLAVLTYLLVERPVRFGMRRYRASIVPALSLTMFAVGMVCWLVYQHDGFAERIQVDLEKYRQLVNSPGETSGCRKSYPFSRAGYCIATPAADLERPLILAIGDSHALALAHGLVELVEKEFPDYSFLAVGRGGCPPFEGVERIDKEKYNCVSMNENVMRLAQDERVRKVLVVGRWSTKAGSGSSSGSTVEHPESARFMANWGGVPVRDQAEIFRVGLSNTLHLLTSAGKQVIFVHQVPELGFDPRSCLQRPFRLVGQHARTTCAVDRDIVTGRQNHYRGITERVLAEFPGVSVFDPLDHLCDERYCHAILDDRLLYSDDDHLSIDGADYLAGKLADLLHQ